MGCNKEVKYGIKTVHRVLCKIHSEPELEKTGVPGSLCAVICGSKILLKGPKHKKKKTPSAAQVTSK